MAIGSEARSRADLAAARPAGIAEPMVAAPRRTLAGYLLLGSAIVTCPCHLPILAVALAPLLAGTALGSFLADNLGLAILGFTAYFVGALIVGLRFVSQNKAAGDCVSCRPADRQ